MDITTTDFESIWHKFIQPLHNKPVRYFRQYHRTSYILSVFNIDMLSRRLKHEGFEIDKSYKHNALVHIIAHKLI